MWLQAASCHFAPLHLFVLATAFRLRSLMLGWGLVNIRSIDFILVPFRDLPAVLLVSWPEGMLMAHSFCRSWIPAEMLAVAGSPWELVPQGSPLLEDSRSELAFDSAAELSNKTNLLGQQSSEGTKMAVKEGLFINDYPVAVIFCADPFASFCIWGFPSGSLESAERQITKGKYNQRSILFYLF